MATSSTRVFALASCLAATFSAASASAHISLDQATTHKSRYGDAYQKEAPCGKAGGTRGTNVYNYKGGETITVEFKEFIPHPSYFRFAFDQDGDDDFVSPASLKPIDPARPCPFNPADKCDKSDFYNSPTVLPMMDNLAPHLASEAKQTNSFQVTLPNVDCDNCTLQLIQVMDDVIHGAYNPTPGDPADNPYIADVYYQCIDLTVAKQATAGGGSGSPPAEDDGGCSVSSRQASGAAGLLVALGLVGLLGVRRRR
jgi:MYXO-CTERM domain-containing protein